MNSYQDKLDLYYAQDRHCYKLRKLPIELHREIYSYIYDDVMVHSWMNDVDITDVIHTICDENCNGITVMGLCELYKKYSGDDSRMFLWKHTIPMKETKFGYWYDDEITDYYKMGNEFSKMLAIEYGKLIQTKNSTKMVAFYKVLSVLIYMYKNPCTTFWKSISV